jgi:hypothetical protein
MINFDNTLPLFDEELMAGLARNDQDVVESALVGSTRPDIWTMQSELIRLLRVHATFHHLGMAYTPEHEECIRLIVTLEENMTKAVQAGWN